MSVANIKDTLDKVVDSYFSAITKETFEYKGKTYDPVPLRVGPLLLRDYTCPASCGGCCHRFTLDYLPTEQQPYELTTRFVQFNGHEIEIHTDYQPENESAKCSNLRLDDGRCGIHGAHPFSCDFELTKFLHRAQSGANLLTKLYGRGWNMQRVDGGRGALCTITPITHDSIAEIKRKLARLSTWADHFQFQHKLPEVMDWIESLPDDLEDLNTYPSEKHVIKI